MELHSKVSLVDLVANVSMEVAMTDKLASPILASKY
jgi:hypothetical protein